MIFTASEQDRQSAWVDVPSSATTSFSNYKYCHIHASDRHDILVDEVDHGDKEEEEDDGDDEEENGAIIYLGIIIINNNI